MMKEPNRRQALFIAEYMIDFNATRAYIAAGYKKDGPNVSAGACKLLQQPYIKAAIAIKHRRTMVRKDITAERVLNEIAKLAFFDPRKLFAEDGGPKEITALDDETAAAVAGLEVSETYEDDEDGGRRVIGKVRKIKIADKGLNLERLGRHLKLFTDKTETSGPDGGPILTCAVDQLTTEQLEKIINRKLKGTA